MKTSKTNFSLPLLVIVLMAGLLLVGVNQAGATTVTYAQDTTWNADVGNITIEAGSDANTVTTTGTTMTITLTSSQTMTLISSDRKLLDNNGGFDYSCSSSESRLIIKPSATTTVVVTPLSTNCDNPGTSAGGGGGGGGGTTTPAATPTPTPTPTPTVSPAVSPTPTPTVSSTTKPTPASRGFVSLSAVSLNDGDVVSAAGSSDPDVYIVNPHGYKRLFLNPAIFGFYGHLGFGKVKTTTSVTRDVFVTSGLFRNCETEDVKVYGVETTGEDTGMLHWVNTTGEQAVADDPDFFKKVFCINTNEFNWYPQGTDYTSVNQIPDYARGAFSASSSVPTSNQYKVVSTVGYLNVRSSASTASSVLGQLTAGDTVTSLAQDGVWHKIMFEGQDAWVHGSYLEEI
ncbi:MAG TPA: SH3 domain-containing protein [Candidatus Paceibacterota bacterium]|nr:SH3 domain-containing protein [Candidatus Paceibacterota bacterium]